MLDLVRYLEEKRAEAYILIVEIEAMNEFENLNQEKGLLNYYNQQENIVSYLTNQINYYGFQDNQTYSFEEYFESEIKQFNSRFKKNSISFDSLDSSEKSKQITDYLKEQQRVLDIIYFLNECKHEYNSCLLSRVYIDHKVSDQYV